MKEKTELEKLYDSLMGRLDFSKAQSAELLREILSDIYYLEINELKGLLAEHEYNKEKYPVWDISCSYDSGLDDGRAIQIKDLKDAMVLRFNTLIVMLEKDIKENQ